MSRRSPSEWRKLALPAIAFATAAFNRLHWLMALLLLAYLGSNVRRIQPDEVAVVLRFGGLVDGRAAVKEAGLLLAWPKPIDEVVVLPVEKVFEVEVRDLYHTFDSAPSSPLSRNDMNPAKTGYALTADHNIVHLSFTARYSISDPIAFVFENNASDQILRTYVGTEATRIAGSMSVDEMLTNGRADLVAKVKTSVQTRLDAIAAGVELVSLELTELGPPRQIASDFTAVQSAEIESQTKQRKAEEYRASQLPLAKAAASKKILTAKADARRLLAKAKADAEQFNALVVEAKKNSAALRIRLYREALERSLSGVGSLRFVPPPIGLRYDDQFRLTLKGNSQ